MFSRKKLPPQYLPSSLDTAGHHRIIAKEQGGGGAAAPPYTGTRQHLLKITTLNFSAGTKETSSVRPFQAVTHSDRMQIASEVKRTEEKKIREKSFILAWDSERVGVEGQGEVGIDLGLIYLASGERETRKGRRGVCQILWFLLRYMSLLLTILTSQCSGVRDSFQSRNLQMKKKINIFD